MRKDRVLIFLLTILMWPSLAAALVVLPPVITSDTTLTLANSPYIVPRGSIIGSQMSVGGETATIFSGEGVVISGAAVTIQPGVRVLFDSVPGGGTYSVAIAIINGGRIIADGSGGDTIIFTSLDDPVYGIGNGSAYPGVWSGIVIFQQGHGDTSVFRNCHFRYGGRFFEEESPGTITTSVSNYIEGQISGSVEVRNSLMELGAGGGILLEGNFVFDIRDNVIDSGFVGVELEGGMEGQTPAGFGSYGVLTGNTIRARGFDPEAGGRSEALSLERVGDTEFTFSNNVVHHQDGLPVKLRLPFPDGVENNSFSSDFINAIGVGGNFQDSMALGDQTMRNVGIPYFLMEGGLTIASMTLTIEPGVVIKLDTGNLMGDKQNPSTAPASIQIGPAGNIISIGTADSPIVFTSVHDDTYGGNTDKDPSIDYAPEKGDWQGIGAFEQPGTTSVFVHTRFRYAGSRTPWSPNPQPTFNGSMDSPPTFSNCYFEYGLGGGYFNSYPGDSHYQSIQNCTFQHINQFGLEVNGGTLFVQGTVFRDCDTAVKIGTFNEVDFGNLNDGDLNNNGGNIFTGNVIDIDLRSGITVKAEGNTFDSADPDQIDLKIRDQSNGGNGTVDFLSNPVFEVAGFADTVVSRGESFLVMALTVHGDKSTDRIVSITVDNLGTMLSQNLDGDQLHVYKENIPVNRQLDGGEVQVGTLFRLSDTRYFGVLNTNFDFGFSTMPLLILGTLRDDAPDSLVFKGKLSRNGTNLSVADTGPVEDTITGPSIFFIDNQYWVDATSGADTNPGQPANLSFKTISKALSLVVSGGTVHIAAGTYNETIAVGTDNITILGADRNSVFLDFNDSSAGTNASGIEAKNILGLNISSLTVRNSYRGLLLDGVTSSRISGIELRNNGLHGIELRNASNSNRIENSSVLLNAQNGINLDNSNSNLFSNNIILSNNGNGLVFASGSSGNEVDSNFVTSSGGAGIVVDAGGNTFTSNRIVSNGTSALQFTENGDSNVIEQNQIIGNSGYGIDLNGGDQNSFRHNLLSANTQGGVAITNGSENLFEQNGLYGNLQYQVSLGGASASDTFFKNNIVPSTTNSDSVLEAGSVSPFSFVRNWWGTSDSAVIFSRIAGAGASQVVIVPYRLAAIDTTVGADTSAPAAPSITGMDTTITGAVELSWSVPVTDEEYSSFGNDLAGYRIYRSTSPGLESFSLLASVPAGDTDYIDSPLTGNTVYFYRVTAFDDTELVNESFYGQPRSSLVLEIADVTGDGKVDFEDYSEIAKAFGTNFAPFDFNKNGKVDVADWLFFQNSMK